ncbi:hypothetical protein MMYC01_209646 [Madurella mycetomatis]|uniref:Uncharacterized protein n=1 Tax=Madurella mycetomatis TaxID=100816 RepID=A0A175VQ64_9PEZI|nr:hypothetical protein MMYC01_209646 [Madurella mycetomatis]
MPRTMTRIPLFILVAVLASFASAAVPTFCKCTCFQNSTIIPLGPQHDNPPPAPVPPPASSSSSSSPPSETSTSAVDDGSDEEDDDNTNSNSNNLRSPNHNRNPAFHWLASRETSTSCKQCNRAFCLKYNLPICKDAEEKDIVTDCFHRDSAKDQIVVWGFILGTAGLLGWAGLRRAVEKHRERQRLGGGPGAGRGAGVVGLGLRGRGIVGGIFGGGGDSGDAGAGAGNSTTGGLWRRGSAGGSRGAYSPLGDGEAGAVR